MDELCQKLSEGDHPVASGGPNPSVESLQTQIERGHVFVKFTATRGGTDLGVPLDKKASDWSKADFVKKTGSVHIEGKLILNYVPVRVVADLNLESLAGLGKLVILGEQMMPGDPRLRSKD